MMVKMKQFPHFEDFVQTLFASWSTGTVEIFFQVPFRFEVN